MDVNLSEELAIEQPAPIELAFLPYVQIPKHFFLGSQVCLSDPSVEKD